MVWGAQALKIVWIVEQIHVTFMRHDVVYHRGRGDSAHLPAHTAQRLVSELRLA